MHRSALLFQASASAGSGGTSPEANSLLRPLVLRERSPGYDAHAAYEPEGSERRALGSIAIGPDAHWLATLTVPIPDSTVAFVQLERSGPLPLDYRGSGEAAHFSIPVAEFDALVALLTGVASQARQEGVLPPDR